jgi:hypothetical protein
VISTIEEVINKTPNNDDIPSVMLIEEEVSETEGNDASMIPIEEGVSETPTHDDLPGVISIEDVISEPSTNGETLIVIPIEEVISESSINDEPMATSVSEIPAQGDTPNELLDNKEQKPVKCDPILKKDPLNQNQKGPRCEITTIGDRYTDNNDGTVTDNRTCLIWLKDAHCLDRQTWAESSVKICLLNGQKDCKTENEAEPEEEDEKPLDCEEYTIGTITGWRLPTLQELQSLMHYDFYNPVISNAEGNERWGEKPENDAFSSVQLDLYWSSTINALGATQAWHIRLTDGNTGTSDKERAKNYVWPVYGDNN